MKFLGNSFNFTFYPAYVQNFLDRMIARDVAAGSSGGLQIEVTNLINNTLQSLVSGGFLAVSGGVISAASSIIKTGGFLTGARTIQGALTPWGADTAIPTIFNFVAGDYNRKTGALGNGTSKYVALNTNNNSVGQNDVHQMVYVTTPGTGPYIAGGAPITGATSIQGASGTTPLVFRNRNINTINVGSSTATGYIGHSRSSSANYQTRVSSTNATQTQVSETPANIDTLLFARLSNSTTVNLYGNPRLAGWSFGTAIADQSAYQGILDAYFTTLSGLTLT